VNVRDGEEGRRKGERSLAPSLLHTPSFCSLNHFHVELLQLLAVLPLSDDAVYQSITFLVFIRYTVVFRLRGVYTMIHVRRTCAPHMYAAHVR